jgi:hypothetical protein
MQFYTNTAVIPGVEINRSAANRRWIIQRVLARFSLTLASSGRRR